MLERDEAGPVRPRVAGPCRRPTFSGGRPTRADDAPPYLTILVTAHIVGSGMLTTSSFAPDLPLVYHMTIWPALTLVLSLVLLPIFKGGLIAHQWALRMHGFEATGVAAPVPFAHE